MTDQPIVRCQLPCDVCGRSGIQTWTRDGKTFCRDCLDEAFVDYLMTGEVDRARVCAYVLTRTRIKTQEAKP